MIPQTRLVEVSTDEHGFLVLRFTDNALKDNIEDFKLDLSVAGMTISHMSRQQNKKIKILLDMSTFSGDYNAEAIDLLSEFAKHNTPYVEKTASFGGSPVLRTAGEVVTAMAHRDNIKVYKTKEEAVTWLLE